MTQNRVRTLLLVEDEVIVARVEAKQLTDQGYKVIIVSLRGGSPRFYSGKSRGHRPHPDGHQPRPGHGRNPGGPGDPQGPRYPDPLPFAHTEKEIVEKTREITSYGYVIKDSGITVLQASVDMAFKLHKAHQETRKAEERLRTMELFNFTLFQYNPIQTVIVDREGRVVKSNLAKMHSGDRLPKIGDLMYRDYAGKHTIDMHEALMACLTSGKPARFSALPYAGKILDIAIAPFTEGAIITSEDITEKANAQEKIRLSEQRLTLAQQAAGAGVWNWDRLTSRLVMSPELYALLGRSPETDEDALFDLDQIRPPRRPESPGPELR